MPDKKQPTIRSLKRIVRELDALNAAYTSMAVRQGIQIAIMCSALGQVYDAKTLEQAKLHAKSAFAALRKSHNHATKERKCKSAQKG